ncbi:MAG TPA: AraC family transcriptional regulator [Phycisphaeraceae bacterium]
MKLPIYQPPAARVMWHVTAHGRQRVPPGRPYWYDNHRRQPRGMVVAQATLAGSIVFREKGVQHAVAPNQLLLFAYGEPTSYGLPGGSSAKPYECEWLCLDGAGLLDHINVLRQRHGSIIDLGPHPLLLREMRTLAAMASPNNSITLTEMAAAVHRLVLRLFQHAEHQLLETLSPVDRAIEQILRQPAQAASIKEWAGRFGCSREHLSRAFHQRMGQPLSDFLSQARLRRALGLIVHTDLPLSAVAAQAGYTCVHTLTRQVRAATGHAPSALRADPARFIDAARGR